MRINFSGITPVKGSPEKLDVYMAEQGRTKDSPIGLLDDETAIVLDGADVVAFYRQAYDIDYPVELVDKSDTEIDEIVSRTPDIYRALEKQFHKVGIEELLKLPLKVIEYYKSRLAAGSDAEGNPIRPTVQL